MTDCQRWNGGRDSRRPAGEPIVTRHHEVVEIPDDTTARAFIIEHHYAKSYPARRFRFCLYDRAELVGVSIFGNPANDAATVSILPTFKPRDVVDLSRFVLHDRVAGNGETWFLGRCFELLADRVAAVTSSSDPLPRTMLDGRVVMPGHVGTIYQAFNGAYRNRARGGLLNMLPDGSVFSDRSWSKIRSAERGWIASTLKLVAWGATPLDPGAQGEERRAWCTEWINKLCRRVSHPGNHRYAWILDRKRQREMPGFVGPKLRYPKRHQEAA